MFKKNKFFTLVFLLSIFSLFLPMSSANAEILENGEAANNNDITRVLCNVINTITGGVGKSFAAITIIITGIGFLNGKLQGTTVVIIVVGIGTMFGAPTIVSAISGGSAFDCATTF